MAISDHNFFIKVPPALSEREARQVLEQARYEVFVLDKQRARYTLVCVAAIVMLMVVVAGFAAAVIAMGWVDPSMVGGRLFLMAVCAVLLSLLLWLFLSWWRARLINPKLREILAREH